MIEYHSRRKVEKPKIDVVQGQVQKKSTIKDTLIQKINFDAYQLACDENRRQEFLDEFARIGYNFYLHEKNKEYTSDFKRNDAKKVIKEMRKTTKLVKNMPVYMRQINDGAGEHVVWVGPLIAELYGLKSGDTVNLIIENDWCREREVKIFEPKTNYNFSSLGGIWIHYRDIQMSIGPKMKEKITFLSPHGVLVDVSYELTNRRKKRIMYKTLCADCGYEVEVPFKPIEDRPVYCGPCTDARERESYNST